MSSIGAALGAAFVSSARAEASRINGAKSRGPKTPAGKAHEQALLAEQAQHAAPAQAALPGPQADPSTTCETPIEPEARAQPQSTPAAPVRKPLPDIAGTGGVRPSRPGAHKQPPASNRTNPKPAEIRAR